MTCALVDFFYSKKKGQHFKINMSNDRSNVTFTYYKDVSF